MYTGRRLAQRTATGTVREALFVSGSVRAVHSHDSRIQDPSDPERTKRETEKQKILNLKGATVSPFPDAPNWNDILASDSEVIVKAERTPYADVKELQDMTIATIEKRDEVAEELDEEIEKEIDAEEAVDSFREESKSFRAGP